MHAKISITTLISLILLTLLSACSQQTREPGSGIEPTMPATEPSTSYDDWGQPMSTPVFGQAYNPGAGEAYLPNNSAPMVMKDGYMDLLVQDTDQSLARVTQLAADQGGYIISTQTWLLDGYKYANVRMSVPASSFEISLNALRLIGLQVLQESASGQDVSTEYRDLQSRLVNLQATAARVREFLNQAQTVEESLRINQTLSDLEGQIETIKGQMTFYERRSAFSTITVSLEPQVPTPAPTPMPTPTPGWNPGSTVSEAGKALTVLGQIVVDTFIWLAVVGGPFVLLALALVWVARRLRRF